MIRPLFFLGVVAVSACSTFDGESGIGDSLRMSLKRPGEAAPTVMEMDGNRWTVLSPGSRKAIGTIRGHSEFWSEVRKLDLERFDGSHVDPYSPEYRWELRMILDYAQQIDGTGTHFGADGSLFDDWNRLASLLHQATSTDIDLHVDRSFYEQQEEAISPPWERFIAPSYFDEH